MNCEQYMREKGWEAIESQRERRIIKTRVYQ